MESGKTENITAWDLSFGPTVVSTKENGETVKKTDGANLVAKTEQSTKVSGSTENTTEGESYKRPMEKFSLAPSKMENF
jgi:hypothetical protein